jgi:hypothetical protein
MERDNRVAEERESFINSVRAEVQMKIEAELVAVASYIRDLKGTIENLQGKVNALQTLVNKYKNRWICWIIMRQLHSMLQS